VGHKKRATLFGIITPMFRGGFLHFLHQWKQEKCSIGELQNLQLYHNCVSTLPEKIKKNTHNSMLSVQCTLMLVNLHSTLLNMSICTLLDHTHLYVSVTFLTLSCSILSDFITSCTIQIIDFFKLYDRMYLENLVTASLS